MGETMRCSSTCGAAKSATLSAASSGEPSAERPMSARDRTPTKAGTKQRDELVRQDRRDAPPSPRVRPGLAHLRGQPAEREALFETIDQSPIAMLITDPNRPDNPIQLANAAFCSLTGYEEWEVVGRNCRFLTGPETDVARSAELRAAIHEQRPALVEILNYRRDGTAFRNGVMVTPLFDENGKLRWYLGSQVNLGAAATAALTMRKNEAIDRISMLSPRQRQVLARMAHGSLNKQIAWDLKISEKTVQMHRAHMLRRLGVATSAEAMRVAIEAGL